MANQRVFQVQALTTNGVAIGGLSTLRFNAAYRDLIESGLDGALGVEDVDRSGLDIGVNLDATDITKINSLLAGTPAETTFYGRESGLATYRKYTIAAASGSILWSGMNLTIAKNSDGRLRSDGSIRFASGSKTLTNVIAALGAQTTPAKTTPVALYRPNTAIFAPFTGESVSPLHVESINLALAAEVQKDYGDTDIGHVAVDITGWRALEVTLVYRDASVVSGSDTSAALMALGRGVLALELVGRGGGPNKTLTVQNLQWLSVEPAHGGNYTDFTLSGRAGWTKRGTPDVNYALNSGSKLFEFEDAA